MQRQRFTRLGSPIKAKSDSECQRHADQSIFNLSNLRRLSLLIHKESLCLNK